TAAATTRNPRSCARNRSGGGARRPRLAVRQFDGVDDDVQHAVGGLSAMTHGTFAALIKPQAPLDDFGSILALLTSDSTLRAQWYYDEDVEWHNIFVPNRSTQVPLTGYANQWAL